MEKIDLTLAYIFGQQRFASRKICIPAQDQQLTKLLKSVKEHKNRVKIYKAWYAGYSSKIIDFF